MNSPRLVRVCPQATFHTNAVAKLQPQGRWRSGTRVGIQCALLQLWNSYLESLVNRRGKVATRLNLHTDDAPAMIPIVVAVGGSGGSEWQRGVSNKSIQDTLIHSRIELSLWRSVAFL